jgi:hypothetical protein
MAGIRNDIFEQLQLVSSQYGMVTVHVKYTDRDSDPPMSYASSIHDRQFGRNVRTLDYDPSATLPLCLKRSLIARGNKPDNIGETDLRLAILDHR